MPVWDLELRHSLRSLDDIVRQDSYPNGMFSFRIPASSPAGLGETADFGPPNKPFIKPSIVIVLPMNVYHSISEAVLNSSLYTRLLYHKNFVSLGLVASV